MCINPPRDPTLHPKSPAAPLMLLGRTWFQTAWRAPHAAKRQVPSIAFATLISLGGTNLAARRHSCSVTTVTFWLSTAWQLAPRHQSPY